MFTKEQLIEQIREMGVNSTDTVVIHTSMRAIGEVDGGADTMTTLFVPAREIFLAASLVTLLLFALVPLLVKLTKQRESN